MLSDLFHVSAVRFDREDALFSLTCIVGDIHYFTPSSVKHFNASIT